MAASVNVPSPPTTEDTLGDQLQARTHQQALLVEVNATLAGAIDVEAVLGQILSRLKARTRIADASIYLLDPEDHLLRCAVGNSSPTVEANRPLALDGPGLIAQAARTAEGVYVPDVVEAARPLHGDSRIRSEYATPLLRGSNVLGALDIVSDHPDGIRAVTRKLVDQIAAQAALAIERSELYKKLRASEQRFRWIFEQTHFGIALCNLHGVFSTVNPAFAQLLGYEAEELRGKLDSDLTHPEDRPESLGRTQLLREGQATQVSMEKRYLRKSGESVWCTTIVSLIRGSAGHPAYFLAMVENISERKRAEEERARLQEQLFQAQKMEAIGTLAGGLAHDFNNFLGVILGFASLVRLRLRPQDPLQEPVRMIEQSAEYAADLTRQLLGLVRHEEHQPEPVNVREIMDRVAKIVTRTFDRRIRVETRLAPELPPVQADASQLEQAVLNLCINARDAMATGGKLTLETCVATLGSEDSLRPAQHPPGDYVRIAVKDTGRGMDPQVMRRIFEPFFTTKEAGEGSGLGLAMVYRIVQDHGGIIHVESQVGQGSEFTIFLPVVQRPAESSKRKEPGEVRRGSGTVLVVDDEPMVLAFAEQGLKKLGYNVLTAANGKRACEIYASQAGEVGCVLLDMVMPEISGLETYQKLREINPQARVILSSGYSMDKIARQALDMGAADFLGKPYSLEKLSLTLRRIYADWGAGAKGEI